MPDAHSLNPFRTLIRNRNFRIFWTGQTILLVESWMQQVAVGWLALEFSNDTGPCGPRLRCRAKSRLSSENVQSVSISEPAPSAAVSPSRPAAQR